MIFMPMILIEEARIETIHTLTLTFANAPDNVKFIFDLLSPDTRPPV